MGAAAAARRHRVHPEVLVLGLAGVLLLSAAVPRLVAAIAGPNLAPRFLISAAALKERGMQETALASSAGSGAASAQDAKRDLAAGLARAPADPAAWAELATLLGARDGRSALSLSLATGPGEGPEFWSRLDLCLADQEAVGNVVDAALVHQQIRTAWRLSPDRLVALVRRHSAAALAKAAFSGRPESERFAARLDAAG